MMDTWLRSFHLASAEEARRLKESLIAMYYRIHKDFKCGLLRGSEKRLPFKSCLDVTAWKQQISSVAQSRNLQLWLPLPWRGPQRRIEFKMSVEFAYCMQGGLRTCQSWIFFVGSVLTIRDCSEEAFVSEDRIKNFSKGTKCRTLPCRTFRNRRYSYL